MIATPQPEPIPSSRRALLAGALGGLGALAAGAIGRATPVRAADGEVIHTGDELTSTSVTKITNTTNGDTVFRAGSGGVGTALEGASVSGSGVFGTSDSSAGVYGTSGSFYGIYGQSGTSYGVYGDSGSSVGVYGLSPTFGVYGEGQSGGVGVQGASSSGYGVVGDSVSSVGVYGESSSDIGVWGVGDGADKPAAAGQHGNDGTGVLGFSGSVSMPAAKAKTGVYGVANQDSGSKGVWGKSSAGHGIHGESSSGFAGYFAGKVYTTTFHELTEINPPAAPAVNKGRLFMRDNGSGKSQLCVRFSSGAIQVLATQP